MRKQKKEKKQKVINIKSRSAKIAYRNLLIRKMAYLELMGARTVKPAISLGMNEAAKLVAMGETDIDNIYHVVEATKPKLTNAITRVYARSDKIFLKLAATSAEKTRKGLDFSAIIGQNVFKDETGLITSLFLEARRRYIQTIATAKVAAISEATRLGLKAIIERGLEDGLSPVDLADRIREKNRSFSPGRALRISRTETHTIAVNAQQQVIREAGFKTEKEWVSAGDNYVRSIAKGAQFDHRKANGERVPLDSTFVMTGEGLMHPGDPTGSAGNVVNCRCVELYHTI
jgi:hypothetical protein